MVVTNRTLGYAQKPVIGYVRVSTAGQAEEGVSLAAQEARVRAWAASGGHEAPVLHRDAGLSGSKAHNRPGLQAALDEVCRRKGVLVVYSLSRLARSTQDAILIAARLEKAGADLVSLTESIDTTSAAGKMVFRMLAVLAEFERDLISERTRGAMAHLRRQGRRISRFVPYGYCADGDHLVEDSKEQNAIRLIARLHEGGSSLRRIAAELQQRRIRTKFGGSRWTPKVLASLIRRASAGAT
jgi:site-specific DNA recombinase